jgi:hypothetical protein
MRTFTGQKSISSIDRLTYTGSKSVFASVAASVSCYLRPLTEEQASMNGFQYGTGFSAIFEVAIDIQEGDRVTIDSEVYTVRGVVNHNRGINTQYKRALLMKSENA